MDPQVAAMHRFYETESGDVTIIEGSLGAMHEFKATLNGSTKVDGSPLSNGGVEISGKVTSFVSTPSRGIEYGVVTAQGHRVTIALRDVFIDPNKTSAR